MQIDMRGLTSSLTNIHAEQREKHLTTTQGGKVLEQTEGIEF
jgi:hypothetical protein